MSAPARVASIRSSETLGRIYSVLEYMPIQGVVLRLWRDSKSKTLTLIELGCCSVNTADMKHPSEVPLISLEWAFVETDHPFGDRTPTTPRYLGSAADVEQTCVESYSVGVRTVRGQTWTNLVHLVSEMKVEGIFSTAVRRMLAFTRANGTLR